MGQVARPIIAAALLSALGAKIIHSALALPFQHDCRIEVAGNRIRT
jgi:hypothetical protein